MPTPTNRQIISALYVATFNRAPDQEGLTFWEGQFTTNSAAAVQQLAAGFASHPAFTTLYDGLDNLNFVEAIYTNVLGAPGDSGGIAFWTQALTSGTLTRSQFLAAFVESALSADFPNPALSAQENADAIIRQDYLTNKALVGLNFADTLGPDTNLTIPPTDPNDLASLEADPAYQASQAILAGVTNDDASVTAAFGLISTASTQTDPIGYINDNALSPPGDTFTLTTNVDVVNASSPNAADIVEGVIDGDADTSTGGSTYTHGDTINGNGNTVVQLVVAEGGDAVAIADLNDIADVDIVAGVGATSVTINAVQWSSVGAVNLIDGANGLDVNLDILEDGVDLSIFSGVSGTISADYQSDLFVRLFAGEASSLSWVYDGDVNANVAASESATFTAFMATGDVTVGNINAEVLENGFFGAFVSSDLSGDINVGDVTITGEPGASVSVSLSNENGGNVTVGNVSQLGGVFEYFGAFNQDATGDVLVGDVAMSVSASGSLFLTVSNTGTTGESLGSLTVGAIDLAIDHDVTSASVDIINSNSFDVDGLSLGALTIGDMTIDLGGDSELDVSITQFADGVTANSLASFGDVTIGNLAANLEIGATFSYDVFIENALSGDIASVAIGDVSLTLNDGATASYTVSVTADNGDITSFALGNVDIALGVDASIDSFSIDLNALNGGNIGTVVIGDVSILGAEALFTSVSNDYNLNIFADGSVDSVTVGNVTLEAGNDAGFQYDASITGDTGVGDVTFGNFDISATGFHTSLSHSVSVDIFVGAPSGDVGSVTLGDISIAVEGGTAVTNSTVDFSVSVTASGDAGVLTVGIITLDTTTDSTVDVNLDASGIIDATINIGGLSLAGTDSITYDGGQLFVGGGGFGGDVNLGDISVGVSLTGITASATSLDLTSVLTNITTTGDISIGSVDYSGLVLSWTALNADAGNGVTIDLGGYLGDTSVIGSQYNDLIFDNTGVNALAGGGGDDIFQFNIGNTGKVLGELDSITDFVGGAGAAGDTIQFDVTNPADFDSTTYFEDSYADFAAFKTGATTQMTSIPEDNLVAGQVGSDVFVAIDTDNGDAIDYIIQLTGVNLAQVNFADYAFV